MRIRWWHFLCRIGIVHFAICAYSDSNVAWNRFCSHLPVAHLPIAVILLVQMHNECSFSFSYGVSFKCNYSIRAQRRMGSTQNAILSADTLFMKKHQLVSPIDGSLVSDSYQIESEYIRKYVTWKHYYVRRARQQSRFGKKYIDIANANLFRLLKCRYAARRWGIAFIDQFNTRAHKALKLLIVIIIIIISLCMRCC